MEGNLATLTQTVLGKGGVDAGNYNPDQNSSLKRNYTDYLQSNGYNDVMTASKRQAANGNINADGTPFWQSATDFPGGTFIPNELNNQQDGVETDEPKIVTMLAIQQGSFPTLIKGDLIFIPGNIGPTEAEMNPLRARGVPMLNTTGGLHILTAIAAKNIAEVNHELLTLQINKLTNKKVQPNDPMFHRHILGHPSDYVNMYRPWGWVYREIDADGGDSEMSSKGWPNVKGPNYVYASGPVNQKKYVSVIHQGLHRVQDIWGDDLSNGTGLFLVLKPTQVERTAYYVTGLDPAASSSKPNRSFMYEKPTERISFGVKDTSGITDVTKQQTIPVAQQETYVVYQWITVAQSGLIHPSFTNDLEYKIDRQPVVSAFGNKNLTVPLISIMSAAWVKMGQVKHQLLIEHQQPDRVKCCNDYQYSRTRRDIEVDALSCKINYI